MIEQLTEILATTTQDDVEILNGRLAKLIEHRRKIDVLIDTTELTRDYLSEMLIRSGKQVAEAKPTPVSNLAKTVPLPNDPLHVSAPLIVVDAQAGTPNVVEVGEPRPVLKTEPTVKDDGVKAFPSQPKIETQPSQPQAAKPRPTTQQRRLEILRVLAGRAGNPMPGKDLATAVGLALGALGYYVCNHPWFSATGAGYVLTNAGRAEATKFPPEEKDDDED